MSLSLLLQLQDLVGWFRVLDWRLNSPTGGCSAEWVANYRVLKNFVWLDCMIFEKRQELFAGWSSELEFTNGCCSGQRSRATATLRSSLQPQRLWR